MNIISMVFAGLLILQIITMNFVFSDYASDYTRQFEEHRLQIACNYASDAATKEMKERSAHLGQDYESAARLNVEPQVAFDVFGTVLCKNYDIPVNTTNIQSVMLDYCPAFIVASYDGYYVLERRTINDSGVENMLFSIKYPYSEVTPNGDLYSYNLSLTSAIKLASNGTVSKVSYPPRSEIEQLKLINDRVSDALNDTLIKYATGDPRGEIYVPAEMTTIRATNPVKNTTVLAYVDNFDLHGYGVDLQCFTIGGSDIRQRKVVCGFKAVKNGRYQKFYTYDEDLPKNCLVNLNGQRKDITTEDIIETFDSYESAAKRGYYYYYQ